MSCTETAKWLNDYLDGELAEETRRSVEEHLGTCLSCHRALTELRSLLERAHRLPTEIEPEEALWPGIVSRITTPAVPAAALAALAEIAETGEIAEGSHRDLSRWFLHKSPLAAAAVLLLAVAVPFTLWQLGRDSVQSPPVAHAERQPDRQIDRQTVFAEGLDNRGARTEVFGKRPPRDVPSVALLFLGSEKTIAQVADRQAIG